MKFSKHLLLIALGLCMVLLGCSRDYVTGKSSYNWFKLKDDVKIGNQVVAAQLQEFDKKNISVNASEDQATLSRLKIMVKKISSVSHLPSLPFEVNLADAPIVNAWAAPGGKMMVYTGLWDPEKGLVHKNNDNEIAAVLAHEIAHATARHVTESISQNMTVALAGAVASSAIAAAGSSQGSDLFNQVFSTGYNIYVPTYSRKNESEADKLGFFYMAKAGYDPRAAIEVWKRAAQKKGDSTSIYATHPSSGERAKALEQYLPWAMEIYRNPNKPYPDFGKKTQ